MYLSLGARGLYCLVGVVQHLNASHCTPKTDTFCNVWGWGRASYAMISYINHNKVEEGLDGCAYLPAFGRPRVAWRRVKC